jgi:hypothetical protein
MRPKSAGRYRKQIGTISRVLSIEGQLCDAHTFKPIILVSYSVYSRLPWRALWKHLSSLPGSKLHKLHDSASEVLGSAVTIDLTCRDARVFITKHKPGVLRVLLVGHTID